MKLQNLLCGVEVTKIIGKTDLEINDVQIDSNKISKNSLFISIKGEKSDGHDYINQAKNYGAIAVVSSKELPIAITQIIVENTRQAMSIIARNFYDSPQDKLKLIGVVGTNGKTTTSHMIYNVLKNAGVKCGLIGTIGNYYRHIHMPSDLTTPDPLSLYKIFSEMLEDEIDTVVMEVSAHAIYYDKTYGLKFEVGVFTNFSQDHLDFFKTLENYEQAKLKFFRNNECKYIVTNIDDSVGLKLSREFKNSITYGLNSPSDIFAIDVKESTDSTSFIINLFDCVYDLKLNFIGTYNVYNAIACATVCALVGVKPKDVFTGLEKISGVKGRLERVSKTTLNIYIDYAHTPDGLEKVLKTLKRICKGRLICLFGCGGNRDNSKRIKMGEISGLNADFTIITSDNPRFEEPMEIIRQIEEGVRLTGKKYIAIQDRVEAIKYAINNIEGDDVLLIAGKGAEEYQDVLGIKSPYNDKDTVIEILRGL